MKVDREKFASIARKVYPMVEDKIGADIIQKVKTLIKNVNQFDEMQGS